MIDKTPTLFVVVIISVLVGFIATTWAQPIYGESEAVALGCLACMATLFMCVALSWIKACIDPLLKKLIKRLGWD